jgi:hypothetical protein
MHGSKKYREKTRIFVNVNRSVFSSLGVATGQIRQKTFRAMKIAGSSLCILDSPFQSLLVGKLQCTFECTVLTGCDYFNIIEQGGVSNGGTKTCQLFTNKTNFMGKLSGCTSFEVTTSSKWHAMYVFSAFNQCCVM